VINGWCFLDESTGLLAESCLHACSLYIIQLLYAFIILFIYHPPSSVMVQPPTAAM
jgi:hypothetical protein